MLQQVMVGLVPVRYSMKSIRIKLPDNKLPNYNLELLEVPEPKAMQLQKKTAPAKTDIRLERRPVAARGLCQRRHRY
jgi:hypothetical protein